MRHDAAHTRYRFDGAQLIDAGEIRDARWTPISPIDARWRRNSLSELAATASDPVARAYALGRAGELIEALTARARATEDAR